MPDPFSLERAAAALDLALEHECGTTPCILVGHSVGGLVAAAEALDHPERVRGLVLVETALRPQIEGGARDSVLVALDADYRALLHTVYVAFGRDTAQGIALYQDAASLDPAILKPWVRLALATDLSETIARLQVPVLAILAERSWPAGESWDTTAQALGYTLIPHVRGERVMGCGHFVMLDRPGTVAQLIAGFCADPTGSLTVMR